MAQAGTLEVLLVDKCGDSVLVDLERRALDLHRALGSTLDFVRRLAVLVSDQMGYVILAATVFSIDACP
jgi:hypothetical protein